MMRIAAAVLLALALSKPAAACMGPDMEAQIFFPDTVEAPQAAVAARLRIESVSADNLPQEARAVVIESLRGDLREGDSVTLAYEVSSCGPHVRAGDEGVVYAEKGEGRYLPYTYRTSDARVSPPR